MTLAQNCPRCNAEVDLDGVVPGTRVVCSRCGLDIIAKPRRRRSAVEDEYGLDEPRRSRSLATTGSTGVSAAPEDEYALVPSPPPGGPARADSHGEDQARARARAEAEVARRRRPPASVRERPPLPPWPMFSGVFDFLLKRDHLDLWLRLGGLLGGTFLLYMLMALMARAGNLLGMVFFLGPPVIATILWTIYAGAWAMAVFRETAEGNDSIEAPEPLPVEWFNDSLYLIIPLIWSALGVVGIGLLFGPILPEGFPWHTVVIFLLWPVLILATAEEGAPWLPAGLGAWASLWNAGRYWLVFYAETVAMVAAAEVLSRIVASIGGVSAIAGLILLAALVPWMWLTYFRLLGRLAAVITHVQGQRLVDEES